MRRNASSEESFELKAVIEESAICYYIASSVLVLIRKFEQPEPLKAVGLGASCARERCSFEASFPKGYSKLRKKVFESSRLSRVLL
ncbi:hypothetical protein NA56DRAFT_181767 [Hyaloscypha hepaticicola]|uniref:Uncharacterized protein n=1 Tax=Hyaloscypha hepaticicola TaxID=2082293 RepID=A0A2J6Q2F6_9HELO|nr:hypothetical protein NA56DRAFT_181767 [Hyaloscypha hepaticicola]